MYYSRVSAIFISYRRVGALVHARALFERLRNEFGPNGVFIDLEGIEYGVDFIEILNEQLNGCQAMLALIDPQWATATDRQGRRRIDREYDYVRTEIVTALSRGIRTVPVLIDGAEMPDPEDLPEPLRPLTRRNALILDFNRFDAEVARLISAIHRILNTPVVAVPSPQGQQTKPVAAHTESSEHRTTPPPNDGPRVSEGKRLSDAVRPAVATPEPGPTPSNSKAETVITRTASTLPNAPAAPNGDIPIKPTPPETKAPRSRALVVTQWAIAVVVVLTIIIRIFSSQPAESASVATPEVTAPPPAEPASAPADTPASSAAAPDQWRPGSANPNNPHVFASAEQNSWHPEAGYIWEKPDDKSDFTVKWSPGVLNSEHPHVFASDKVGVWSTGVGYVWVQPNDQNNLDVRWSPGVPYPNHPHVVASSKPDNWDPEPGYNWVNPKDPANFEVVAK
jgi:hypothetical protein